MSKINRLPEDLNGPPAPFDETAIAQFIAARTGEPLDIVWIYLAKRRRYEELNKEVDPQEDPAREQEQQGNILTFDGGEDPHMVWEYVRRTTGLEATRSANMYGEEIFYRESRLDMDWGSYLLMRHWIDDFIESSEDAQDAKPKHNLRLVKAATEQ